MTEQPKVPVPQPEQAKAIPAIDEKNEVPTPNKSPETSGKVGEEREPGALLQQGHDDNKFVNLPSLISDEFGTHRSLTRLEVMQADILIDNEPYDGDKLNVEYELIAGKTIDVKSPTRSYRFKYEG